MALLVGEGRGGHRGLLWRPPAMAGGTWARARGQAVPLGEPGDQVPPQGPDTATGAQDTCSGPHVLEANAPGTPSPLAVSRAGPAPWGGWWWPWTGRTDTQVPLGPETRRHPEINHSHCSKLLQSLRVLTGTSHHCVRERQLSGVRPTGRPACRQLGAASAPVSSSQYRAAQPQPCTGGRACGRWPLRPSPGPCCSPAPRCRC